MRKTTRGFHETKNDKIPNGKDMWKGTPGQKGLPEVSSSGIKEAAGERTLAYMLSRNHVER